MTVVAWLGQRWFEFLAAVQFLTRVPVPALPWHDELLARSVKFFPVAGLLIGAAAAGLHLLLSPHLPRLVSALAVVLLLVLLTGGLHEDGLADSADGFGGGYTRERILLIMRDSRIGSYGGLALVLAVLSRVILIASLPSQHVSATLVVACMLCRWTTLPLSYFLHSARSADGQGARIAWLTSSATLIGGTLFSFAIAAWLLGMGAIAPIVGSVLIVGLSGIYYQRRIGGVTGDCFGATNQLAEIGVYLCGAWTR